MNKLTITGNLTKDPELRKTQSGKDVCTFTVAVNRKRKVEGQPEADYFRVTAWEDRGRVCHQFLTKGKKVAVVGPVSVNVHTGQDGKTYANLEVLAEEVEFLSPKGEQVDPQSGYTRVDNVDGLPY